MSQELKNAVWLIIGNLNVNRIANKFDQLKAMIQGKVNNLVITENKLDSIFPTRQFYKNGFSGDSGEVLYLHL